MNPQKKVCFRTNGLGFRVDNMYNFNEKIKRKVHEKLVNFFDAFYVSSLNCKN
jgi:hypothetical protein